MYGKCWFNAILLVACTILPLQAQDTMIARGYLNLEAGFLFPLLSDINEGIQGKQTSLQSRTNVDFSSVNISQFTFANPISFTVGFRPFDGVIGTRISLFIRSGYTFSRSINKITFTDTTLNINYGIDVIPLEIGASFAYFRNSSIELTFFSAASLLFGYFTIDYQENPNYSGENLDVYPKQYSGMGIGFLLGLGMNLSLSKSLDFTFKAYYRSTSIDTLKGDIEQDGGGESQEQLYLDSTGFVSASSQPANSSSAILDMSGFAVEIGIKYKFGFEKLTYGTGTNPVYRKIQHFSSRQPNAKPTSLGVSVDKWIIRFKINKYGLSASEKIKLNQVAQFLKKHKEIRIYLEAFTDDTSTYAYNLNLARNRARVVRYYLFRKGISLRRISYKAWGPLHPRSKRKTTQDRKRNRRVEILFIQDRL